MKILTILISSLAWLLAACTTSGSTTPHVSSETPTIAENKNQSPIHTITSHPSLTPYPTLSQTQTSQPSPTFTYTSTPTMAPQLAFGKIHMMDAQHGWAWAMTGRLLRTIDGGKTWIDRTPGGYYSNDGFFLDAQNAWLPVHLLADFNRIGLLRTIDGGQSWVQYPQGPASGLYFVDAQHGWAVSGDIAAGSVFFSLSQTKDGGKTWAPISVKTQESEAGFPPGTIHLCNICNDAFYYDPSRLMIIYGDLGTLEPTGAVRTKVTFDMGNTWQTKNLPLPQGESDALVAPNLPVFFNNNDGLLPVHLLKNNEGSFSEQKMVFYATSDGGASWSQLPNILDSVQWFTSIQVDPSYDIFIICGSSLCASHDMARTWQTLSSNLDFTPTDTHAVSEIDFIDSATGWALVQGNEATSLYQTTDGGLYWVLLSPLLVPAPPPTVTIDTSIPTP